MARVTVFGAGIFGLCVAFSCLRRGAHLRVVEPRAPGAGASGGLVGALAPHVPENWNAKKAFQLRSLLRAASFWDEVARLSGRDPGYARIGRLQPLADEAAVTRERARRAGAAAHWPGWACWEVVAEPSGWAPVSPSGLWVHDTLSARLHPARAIEALAGAVRALGGEIVPRDTAGADGPVVWATGHEGLAAMSQGLARRVGTGVKGQALLVAHDARGAPQIQAEGLHVVPHADGTVAIGSTSEREFDAPDTVDAQLDVLHGRAVEVCPALAGAPVLRRWAGVRPRARTRAPMLGPWPGRPGHYVANGGFKIGFGVAPEIGEVMADLILYGHDAIPEGFRVEDNL